MGISTWVSRAWSALHEASPTAGGAVMGTAILSTALRDERRAVASAVLLGLALAGWAVLAAVMGTRIVRDRPRARAETVLPSALTGVAATAVLGTRLEQAGDAWAGWIALALAAAVWLALVARVLAHWRRPTDGGSFLLVVATESLAVLLAVLGGEVAAVAALVLAVAGLAAYAWVLRDFDSGQVGRGAGDHWVAGGALAIAALAGAEIARSGALASAGIADASVVVFALALAWLPLLVAGELLRPRPGFDVRRWATAFPLGMYAAAGYAVGAVDNSTWPRTFAAVWVWVAAAVWVLVAAAAGFAAVRTG